MDTSKPKNEPSPRFDIADEKQREQGLKYLEDHGYAVFAEVADAKECKHAENLLWAFLHSLPLNIRQHDIDSWERFPDWSSTTGILFGNGIGQSEFLWFLRGLPRVKQVFESIWQTDELLTSFDGCGLMRPWQYKPKWQTQGSWWHIDQHPVKKPGKICVQGLVSLYDADETTGNLIIIPDSHKLFDQPVITSINARSDFVRIPKPTMEHIEQELGLKAKMVSCKAGDLVLWDSRTIHCNAPALTPPPQPAKNEPYRLLRAAAYICMTPSAFAKDLPDLRRKRYEAFVRQWTSSHWPQDLKLSSSPELPDNRVKLNLQQKALLMGCRADEEQVASLEQAAAEALGRENDQASKQKNHIVWKKKK